MNDRFLLHRKFKNVFFYCFVFYKTEFATIIVTLKGLFSIHVIPYWRVPIKCDNLSYFDWLFPFAHIVYKCILLFFFLFLKKKTTEFTTIVFTLKGLFSPENNWQLSVTIWVVSTCLSREWKPIFGSLHHIHNLSFYFIIL